MAVIKPVSTPQGIIAEYHKLLECKMDMRRGVMVLTVAIYANQAARDSDAMPVWHEYPEVPFTDLTQDPRDMLYPMLVSYVKSYLAGGAPDPTMEGFTQPGNTSISLIPEMIIPFEV